jgi:aspartyl-tRNA(Asn)/glutamyl-tRNA(Gln) amidotransferase subunit A
MVNQLHLLTAHELSELYDKGTVTPREAVDSVLRQIDSVDPKVKAYILVNRDSVYSQLSQLSSRKGKGKLWGIPVVIKDNICVRNEKTTCASKILAGFEPPYEATVVEKLRSEGAILLGKANMDEFAFGSSCENSAYWPTRNPWNLNTAPGGSSGGSAAAVASGETILALGSDTGGSIRQPASFCGVVGLKPTYGRVSRYGLIAFASSLDQIGPITKDVYDASLLLGAIAGYDSCDSTSADMPVADYTAHIKDGVKGLRVGVPREYFVEGIDPQVEKCVDGAVKVLERLGAKVEEISLPHTEYAVSVYYIIATAEASSNLARFDGVQYGYRAVAKSRNTGGNERVSSLTDMYERTRGEGFGPEAKRRIILGTYVLSSGYYDAYYLKAQKVRTLIKNDFDEAFKECDCIVTPTSPTAAFKIGEKIDDPLKMYLSDIYTIPANLAGIPAISVNCGFTGARLPVGLQLLGRPYDEETLLRIAYTYEQNTDWHEYRPNLS